MIDAKTGRKLKPIRVLDNAELREALYEALRAGCFLPKACAAVRVSYQQVYELLSEADYWQGGRERPAKPIPHSHEVRREDIIAFSMEVRCAEATFERDVLLDVWEHGSLHDRMWVLERRFPHWRIPKTAVDARRRQEAMCGMGEAFDETTEPLSEEAPSGECGNFNDALRILDELRAKGVKIESVRQEAETSPIP